MLAAAEAQLAAAEGDLAAGREHLAAAMTAAVSSKDRPILAAVVIAVADLACREGDADRAARLLGASIVARGAEDRSAPDVPRVARAARATLGDEAYDSAFGAGRASTLEGVLALAGPG